MRQCLVGGPDEAPESLLLFHRSGDRPPQRAVAVSHCVSKTRFDIHSPFTELHPCPELGHVDTFVCVFGLWILVTFPSLRPSNL